MILTNLSNNKKLWKKISFHEHFKVFTFCLLEFIILVAYDDLFIW